VLAPEYGGETAAKTVGLCAQRPGPRSRLFPGHWAPNALAIYLGTKVFRPGLSRRRLHRLSRLVEPLSPCRKADTTSVFQPLADGKASGPYVVFADGFAGQYKEPGPRNLPFVGVSPFGPELAALYVGDDVHGRILAHHLQRQRRRQKSLPAAATPAAKPATASQSRPAARGRASRCRPPERPPCRQPPGATPRAGWRLGNRIFHGEAANGACSGCHGSDAGGSPVGPPLNNGTLAVGRRQPGEASATIIAKGVPKAPSATRARWPPPWGGSPLSKQDLAAVVGLCLGDRPWRATIKAAGSHA